MVEELDTKVKALTDKMYQEGIDAKTVAKIVADKEAAEARSAKLYWEVCMYLCMHVCLCGWHG